jgi:hypothetical protein
MTREPEFDFSQEELHSDVSWESCLQQLTEGVRNEVSQNMFGLPFDELDCKQAKQVKNETLIFIEEREKENLFQRGGVTDNNRH